MKQHPEYPEIWVTEDGRVFRELTPITAQHGYHIIQNGKFKVRRHTLVCGAYHGAQPMGHEVRHLDGDHSNDHASNLAWGTHAENMQDAVKHGTHYTGAKITKEIAAEIRARREAGESGKSLAIEFGLSEQTVCCIYKGRIWNG